MHIIEFAAENFMKLKAVRIRPEGANMVVLSGKNGAGKSSILNAIMAVVDKAALKKQGITKLLREGQERGFVKIDLGDIIAKLTLTERGEYLTVENKEGMAFKSPAGVMDRLRGMISFDPLAFAKMEAKKQKDILLGLVDVGIDLDAHDKERARIFDERTNVGRKRETGGLAKPSCRSSGKRGSAFFRIGRATATGSGQGRKRRTSEGIQRSQRTVSVDEESARGGSSGVGAD